MTAYAPPPAYPVADVRYRNGLGLTSLILGLVALTLCWIPFINYLSVVLGLVGIVLAIVGFARIGKRGANNPVTTAIGALVSARDRARVRRLELLRQRGRQVDHSVREGHGQGRHRVRGTAGLPGEDSARRPRVPGQGRRLLTAGVPVRRLPE